MSEISDTDSSCGWTLISNEGSDIETLGSEAVLDSEQHEAGYSELGDTPASSGECGKVGEVDSDSLEVTLVGPNTEETLGPVEAEAAENEPVSVLSSSDHSDIQTLGDSKDDEQITAETTEEFYLGMSCSSQYTFSAAETVFPVQPPVMPNSSSSEDESDPVSEAVMRRRRVRRNTPNTTTEDKVIESGLSEREEGPREQHDEQTEDRLMSQSSSVLNRCILLALIIAISMGFGHFYGTVQIQERQKNVEKVKVNELDGLRDLIYLVREQSGDQSQNDLDAQKAVSLLSELIEKLRKQNLDLSSKHAQIQAQRHELELQQQRLVMENHHLKHSLEKEERSLSELQDELGTLRLKIKDLEAVRAGADSLLSENQRLKAELEQEKHVIRSFSGKREGFMVEAQTLKKKLDNEQKITDELRREINELRQRISGAEEEATSGATELQSRLMELEKKLSFEQQRSDLWERLYLETKEERAKGDSEPKVRKPKSKQGMAGKVKETFDAVKNSTKEFVHHHKEQIKKAKEAVKANLRKFSDSVKSTFRNFKDSASTLFDKARGFYDKRKNGKNTDESWQHRSNRPDKHPFRCDSFQSNHCTRKSADKVYEEEQNDKFNLNGCSGVFDCAYQESMNFFNKATEPIRADEFYQLLQSYIQQEVDHFHHWKELERFINNFFHNGVFIHDQMLFTDFVNKVEDYLNDMYKYHGFTEDVFGDLDDYIYRHIFGKTYSKKRSPSGPFEKPKEDSRAKHQHKQQKSRQSSERKWSRSDRNADRHMTDVKIELGPMPFDPKY